MQWCHLVPSTVQAEDPPELAPLPPAPLPGALGDTSLHSGHAGAKVHLMQESMLKIEVWKWVPPTSPQGVVPQKWLAEQEGRVQDLVTRCTGSP